MSTFPRALFVSHGGGPLPLLGDPGHRDMVATLQRLAASLPKPKAVVVVSAHWETAVPTLTAAANPTLLYDYHGFPPESYAIRYPCPGDPTLAGDLQRRLIDAGLEARLDPMRGLDHGVFVPMALLYPAADIPCVQLSMGASLDPASHLGLGQALADLHRHNILLIGSGFSFHNLRAFFSAPTEESKLLNAAFEDWLQQVCMDPALDESRRRRLLLRWHEAPGARFCHPREEHLLPLHVCYGAAQGPASRHEPMTVLGRAASCFVW